jgi:hypothetical protein
MSKKDNSEDDDFQKSELIENSIQKKLSNEMVDAMGI